MNSISIEYDGLRSMLIEDYKKASTAIELPYELQELVLDLGGGQALQYINNPSRAIQLKAFSMDPAKAIPYITDEDLLIDIIREYPKAIIYVINPSNKLQLECVKRNKKCFNDIIDPCDEVIRFMRRH